MPLQNDVVFYSIHAFDDSYLPEDGSPEPKSDNEGHGEADPAANSELDIFSAIVDVHNTQDLLLRNQASLNQAFESLKIDQDSLLWKFNPTSDSE